LESLFDDGKVPPAKVQADQLVADVGGDEMPVVVMGDFNSDPRDPRAKDDPNLGEQPSEGGECKAQAPAAQAASADDSCSAYWTMVHAGFTDAGPNPRTNLSWGYTALLDGNDAKRPQGFTDRLDYVFTKNMGVVADAHLVGNTYPTGKDMWACGQTMCAPSDHAGLVATVTLPSTSQVAPAPPSHSRTPFGFWKAVLLSLALIVTWRVRRRLNRRKARKSTSS
jgi:endonuclease/exonuclease/phosphatase family metal-dependent hydrolase